MQKAEVSVLLEKFLTLLVQFILSLFLFLKTQNNLLARGITHNSAHKGDNWQAINI